MQINHDFLDDEHYIELLITEAECLAIMGGSMMTGRPMRIMGKYHNFSIRQEEEPNAFD